MPATNDRRSNPYMAQISQRATICSLLTLTLAGCVSSPEKTHQDSVERHLPLSSDVAGPADAANGSTIAGTPPVPVADKPRADLATDRDSDAGMPPTVAKSAQVRPSNAQATSPPEPVDASAQPAAPLENDVKPTRRAARARNLAVAGSKPPAVESASRPRLTLPNKKANTPAKTHPPAAPGGRLEAVAQPAEKKVLAPPAAERRELHFGLADLPMQFAGDWSLDRRTDWLDGRDRCLLFSPKLPIFDGYAPSSVQLEISMSSVVARADSNIDTGYPQQGLQVDGGALVPFAPQLLNERTAYTNKPVQPAMATGSNLTVALGFWPTWPVKQTQHTSLDLKGFHEAYRALQACARQFSDN
jgi:hypothetical protein